MKETVVYSVPIIAAFLWALRTWRTRKWLKCKSTSILKGKTVIITGANSGLGKVTTEELARRHARVIMACRNKVSARKAIADIRKTTQNGELVFMPLDLGSFESIREFCSEVMSTEKRLDVLILNAGIAASMKHNMKSRDGFEAHFGVNHLGHFLLTNLLSSKLEHSVRSRVVVVSSSLYKKGVIEFDNLNCERGWRDVGHASFGYCNSKLANMLFARQLCSRLHGVDVYAICPGWVYTNLSRYDYPGMSWFKKLMVLPFMFLFMKTPRQGVQTILHCVLEDSLESGSLYVNCERVPWEGQALSQSVGEELWKVSENLVGLNT